MANDQFRLLLCRPEGGLNDVLCQIERCWDYAERFNRNLVIDLSKRGLMSAVFDCLELKGKSSGVVLGMPDSLATQLSGLTVRPSGIQGRINEYTKEWRGSKWVDAGTQQAITFDFDVDLPEELLVHEQAGGGTASQKSILRFTVKSEQADAIRGQLPELPEEYDAIHIRSTDYKTHFSPLLRRLARKNTRLPLLVCSDNNAVFEEARSLSSRRRIITFPNHPITNGLPLHRDSAKHDNATLNASAHRLLAEMYALSSARTLHYGPVFLQSATEHTQFSGFSVLLGFLTENHEARQGFFGVELTGISPKSGKVSLMVRKGEKTVLRLKHAMRSWSMATGFRSR